MDDERTDSSPQAPLPLGQRLKRTFFTGLVLLVPAALSVWVLLALFHWMDGIFAPRIQQLIDPLLPGFYIPGFGVILTVLLIFLLGWISNNVFGNRIVLWLGRMIARVPVAGSIYSASKTLMEAVSHDQSEAFKRVVLIEYPRKGLYALAFVTGSRRWPTVAERTADLLLVFVPSTPNPTSGFLLLVPREEAIELSMSVETGVQMVISGGIVSPRTIDGPPSKRSA